MHKIIITMQSQATQPYLDHLDRVSKMTSFGGEWNQIQCANVVNCIYKCVDFACYTLVIILWCLSFVTGMWRTMAVCNKTLSTCDYGGL